MENMCTNSTRDENENHDEEVTEITANGLSPACAPLTNPTVMCFQSPDDYFPASQIVRNSKRFSDCSGGHDPVIRMSLLGTPPSVKTTRDLQVPLIHTLGTLVRNNPNLKFNFVEVTGNTPVGDTNFKTPDVFEGLGMTDKDISWVSTMETPAPLPLTLNEYNTIEKATFLPESDLKNMQPRALFSPNKNDDSDCLPLTYSSEGEDGAVNSCSSKTQLADMCETLKEISMGYVEDSKDAGASVKDGPRSLTQKANEICKKEPSAHSPVFVVKSKRGRLKSKKVRSVLVVSPVVVDENDVVNEQCNSIQDDSFQNMSFSCIDELCKNSIPETNNSSDIFVSQGEDRDLKDSAPEDAKSRPSRFFYNETIENDRLVPVTSTDNFFKAAKALEEVDVELERKTREFLMDEEYIVFNDMKYESESLNQGTKRLREECSSNNSPNKVKKMMIRSDCLEEELISLPSIQNKDHKLEQKMINEVELIDTGQHDALSIDVINENFPMFATALGKPISVSDDAYRKVKRMFGESEKKAEEEHDSEDKSNFQGFKTASGAAVKISEKSLKKVQTLFRDLDVCGNNVSNEINSEAPERKPAENKIKKSVPSIAQFKTASNNEIFVTEKSLNKVKALWKGEMELEEDKEKSPAKTSLVNFCGFSTASGKNIDVSETSLTKARKILHEETKESKENVVDAAVKTSRSDETPVLQENDVVEEDSREGSKLIPSWLHTYNTSPTLTMDRMHLPAVTSHEDCNQNCTRKEQYLIKSPLLGTNDRFFSYRKRKNPGRKLVFDAPPKAIDQHFTVPYKDRNRIPAVKREVDDLKIDFAVPFKRRKVDDRESTACSEDMENLAEEVVERRRKARSEQMESGRKGKVKPVKGSHMLKKEEPQMSWREAVGGSFPEQYAPETLRKLGVRDDVLEITALNALSYKMKSTDFYSLGTSYTNMTGFPVGDGCTLIFDDNNMAGVDEFIAAFFASPGVEPNLISPEWVKNHFKWIVWKFSKYERCFPHIFGGRCLTPHNILVQLKYRYDREIDRSHRSALKKILECDESVAKRMVLCVSDIKKVSNLDADTLDSSNKSVISYILGVNDGWYSCYAQTDGAMTRLIEERKVTVGTKLITQGAELLNCDKGVSPLEAANNVHLKLSTNSTRLVKWDIKLGIQRHVGPILVSLNSILPNGGVVGRIDVVIMRVYPVLYMEKKSDGSNVIRNSRAEDKEAAAFQQQQEVVIEKIYQQVNDEMQRKSKEKEKISKKISISSISKITDPEELCSLYESYSDPTTFQDLLSDEQKQILINYQHQKKDITNKELSEIVREKIKMEKMNIRKVSQLLRIKIVDLHKRDYNNPVLFTVWNCTEHITRMLSEGKAFSIYNTTPSSTRFQKTVQLNSTRQTQFKELSQVLDYPARKLTRLDALTFDCDHHFNEVDIAGVVVLKNEVSYGSRLSQTIYLADSDFNFAGIVFWGTCKDYGWENVLTLNSVVACSNLSWNKTRSSHGIPSVYVSDSSVFTENPKQCYFKEEIKRLKASLSDDMQTFVSKCEENISLKLEEQKQGNTSRTSNDSGSNLSFSLKPKYTNGFKSKPNASSTPFKSISPGVMEASEQDPSPIQKRMEKLQAYGEPPPLSPLLPLDNLDRFRTKFRVPFKTADSVIK